MNTLLENFKYDKNELKENYKYEKDCNENNYKENIQNFKYDIIKKFKK